MNIINNMLSPSVSHECPWEISMNGDDRALCKHICDTICVSDDVEIIGAIPCNISHNSVNHYIEIILKKNGKTFRYKILKQLAETGEPSLQASTALAQLIIDDTLLLQGVSDFECSPTNSFIVFHGRHFDISPYFNGTTIQTSAIVTEIIRQISNETNNKHICSIGMVPIKGNIAFLKCENYKDGHRFYEETNIRKWVLEYNSSPFTRKNVLESDICIHGPAILPISKQPSLPHKRKEVQTDKKTSKKIRKNKKKHIVCVWDRSGSMKSMGSTPLNGLKKLVQEQQSIALSSGNHTKMTLYTFDNEMEIPLEEQDISTVDIDEQWLTPRGTTSLYDTIVTAVTKLKKNMQDEESGVLIVMTDGVDNASECNSKTVKNALLSLPKSVECIFMAANVGDAQELGDEMGFKEDMSLTFTPEASQAAFECMSQSARRSVSGGSAAFTRLERQSSVKTASMPVRTKTSFI